MSEMDVITLLRHYRHDLLNQLQIVQGYLSMGKADKAETTLKDYMRYLREEGSLLNLTAPIFVLYILEFKYLHTNFRLSYHIDTEERSLQSADPRLAAYCQEVMESIENAADEQELYDIDVQLHHVDSSDMIGLEISVAGKFADGDKVTQMMDDMGPDVTVRKRNEQYVCSVMVSDN